ncbi:MAG: hypothetical protein ABEI52_03215, partial [Halobacteriaceae archaeon]
PPRRRAAAKKGDESAATTNPTELTNEQYETRVGADLLVGWCACKGVCREMALRKGMAVWALHLHDQFHIQVMPGKKRRRSRAMRNASETRKHALAGEDCGATGRGVVAVDCIPLSFVASFCLPSLLPAAATERKGKHTTCR